MPRRPERRLSRAFFAGDARDVAPALLGMVIECGSVAGRIVETEAYRGADDPASHGHRGPTPRSQIMFGPPGHLYVYFSYGMHWCANVVCGAEGDCAAVLIRSIELCRGIDVARQRRPKARLDRDLANGPAKLCAALGITGAFDGVDVTATSAPVRLIDDGVAPMAARSSRRIGLAPGKGDDLPWRFTPV